MDLVFRNIHVSISTASPTRLSPADQGWFERLYSRPSAEQKEKPHKEGQPLTAGRTPEQTRHTVGHLRLPEAWPASGRDGPSGSGDRTAWSTAGRSDDHLNIGARRFDLDDQFKKRGYDTVGKPQRKEPQVYNDWKLICDISREDFSRIYDGPNVKNLVERGGSFYRDPLERLYGQQSRALRADGRYWGEGRLQERKSPAESGSCAAENAAEN